MVGAILLAAGSGKRMKGEMEDKLLHPIGDSNAFKRSYEAFLQTDSIEWLVIVYKNDSQLSKLKVLCTEVNEQSTTVRHKEINWVEGGEERQDSVWAGLHTFPEKVTHVLVHDCARPFIRSTTISLMVAEVIQDRALTVARPLKDTLRLRTERNANPIQPTITRTIDRSNHWLIETPQGSPKEWLIEGFKKARKDSILITDDMAAVELCGRPIGMIDPGYPNPKITTPDDFCYAEFLAQS
jgi:2-C-methyl-D-erythritol 4-phosphate cytidylyltransferase